MTFPLYTIWFITIPTQLVYVYVTVLVVRLYSRLWIGIYPDFGSLLDYLLVGLHTGFPTFTHGLPDVVVLRFPLFAVAGCYITFPGYVRTCFDLHVTSSHCDVSFLYMDDWLPLIFWFYMFVVRSHVYLLTFPFCWLVGSQLYLFYSCPTVALIWPICWLLFIRHKMKNEKRIVT